MTDDTTKRAEAYLALAEKATPGPWTSEHHKVSCANGVPVAFFSSTRGKTEWERENRNFIAAAHEGCEIIRALLAERNALREALRAADDDLRAIHAQPMDTPLGQLYGAYLTPAMGRIRAALLSGATNAL